VLLLALSLTLGACTGEVEDDGEADAATPITETDDGADPAGEEDSGNEEEQAEEGMNTSEPDTAISYEAESTGEIDQDLSAIDGMFDSVSETDFGDDRLADDNIGL
jgi:hypothetical protein